MAGSHARHLTDFILNEPERSIDELEDQMTETKTLRTIARLAQHPAPLRESALVLVDCQNTYRSGIMALDGVEPALEEAGRLLRRARALGIPIMHIQHDAGPGSPYDIRAEIGAIADVVAPRAGEPVIVKHLPNSFIGTDLQDHLAEHRVEHVVLAGFMTHMCINSTARGAFNLGFKPAVVAAATATRNLLSANGMVPAAVMQQASLAGLGDLFAVVVADEASLPD